MKKIYAVIGDSAQTFARECPADMIEMQTSRPDGDYIAGADGQWVAYTPIPEAVTPRQIRQALTAMGLRAAVETAVAAGDQGMKDWWEFSENILRAHPLVAGMGVTLGVTPTQIDDLFILANSL